MTEATEQLDPVEPLSADEPKRAPLTIPVFENLPALEAWLRVHGGFSRREATGIVSACRTLLKADSRDSAGTEAVLAALRHRTQLLQADSLPLDEPEVHDVDKTPARSR